MKKIITLLLVLLVITGCSKNETIDSTVDIEETVISVVTPSGAPTLSLLEYADNNNFDIDVVDGSEVLQAEFVKKEADMIVAPINLGVKLSESTGNYKLAAVLTWGNLYLVSSKEDFNEGEVAAFGEASVPGKVIGYLNDELKDYEFIWFGAVNEVSSAFLTGEYDAAIIAEPYLSMTKSKAKNTVYDIINLQDLYSKKSGYESYPQSALFINTDAIEKKKDAINKYLIELKDSIVLFNEKIDELIQKIDNVDMEKLGFANPDLIKKAYTKMAIKFVKADECQDQINDFLKLYGMEATNEIIY